MTPAGIPKIRGPKRCVQPLTGVEKCPKCGALQNLKDRFVIIKFDDRDVECWSCHACGHAFRICEGQVLEIDQWKINMRPGTNMVELKDE